MGLYNPRETESQILEYWLKHDVPGKLAEQRKGEKKFFLLDGPPYINAEPHVGHVKTTVRKDVWSRLRYMQNYDVWLQPGFDCHGLPVEVMVEKELGIESKQQIEEMGIERFEEQCLKKILNNERTWIEYYKRIGAWRAFFEPYFTYKTFYIESAWWTAKQLHEKGMFVQGEYPIHWCPHCETALSGYEVSDSSRTVNDPSIFVKFKIAGKQNEFLLVWTTTPWTLPSNAAIVVDANESYVKVRAGNEYYIVAEKLLKQVMELKKLKHEVVEKFSGKELDGMQYEALLDVSVQKKLGENAHRVYLSIPIMKHKKYKKHVMNEEEGKEEREEFEHFVSMNEGTGLVHAAPGHGLSDFLLGQHYGIPAPSPLDDQGKFTGEAAPFNGLFVKQADKKIVEALEKDGKLFHSTFVSHSYPLCWRCKSPLIFRLSKQWYLKIDSIKEKMIEQNDFVQWLPSFGRESFRNWLLASQDWAISQQRYWGIPIPIWVCSSCGARKVIGSVKELRQNALLDPGELQDLHRHTVDKIVLRCVCGKHMNRIKDIFNVWFDSGISPWASLGYPLKNKQLFEQMFPVDLVNESQDQIRGWFYSLMFCSTACFDKPAFKSVAMMGWVLDEKGEKMSKSLGNVVAAIDGIERLGADALRLYYCWEIAPWDVQKFSFSTAEEVTRALNILWNSLAFLQTYGGTDTKAGFNYSKLWLEEKWLLSRLNSLNKQVLQHFEQFELHHVGRKIVAFAVEDFSRWYIRLVRDKVSLQEKSEEKQESIAVMRHVLLELSKLLAPITPFLSERFFQELGGKEGDSVHFQQYPSPNEEWIDEELEELMEIAMQLTEAANAARQEAKIKLRWPIKELAVSGGEKTEHAVELLQEILCSANNCKTVSFTDAPAELEKLGFASKEFASGKVFINPRQDREMVLEALLRELVRAVQEQRKKSGFQVREKISLTVSAQADALEFLSSKRKQLAAEVGAKSVSFDSLHGEWEAQAEAGGFWAKARFSKTA